MNMNDVLQMLIEARDHATLEAGPLTFRVNILVVKPFGETAPIHQGFQILVRTIGPPTEKLQTSEAHCFVCDLTPDRCECGTWAKQVP